MSELTENPDQLNIYYLPGSETSKQLMALLQESRVPVHTIDLSKDRITPTQVEELLNGLAMQPEELVSKDSPEFKDLFPDVDLDTADWLTMIVKHPEIIRRPIAKRGKKVKVIEVPTEILKFIELETY